MTCRRAIYDSPRHHHHGEKWIHPFPVAKYHTIHEHNKAIMMRLTTFLTALLAGSTAAYTVSPQRSSHFVGHGVYHTTSTASRSTTNGATLEMKKGKPNVPANMRSQYARAQEMESYRQQMMDSQKMGSDGLPVFNLYVRTSLKNVSGMLLKID